MSCLKSPYMTPLLCSGVGIFYVLLSSARQQGLFSGRRTRHNLLRWAGRFFFYAFEAVRFSQDFFLQEFSRKATPEMSCQFLPKILSLARLSVRLTQDVTRISNKSCMACVNRTAPFFTQTNDLILGHQRDSQMLRRVFHP